MNQALAGQSEPPADFAPVKQPNRDRPPGPPPLDPLPRVDANALDGITGDGAVVADIRPTARFMEGHLRGSLNFPAGASLTKYAGSLVASDARLVLVDEADSDASIARVRRTLSL